MEGEEEAPTASEPPRASPPSDHDFDDLATPTLERASERLSNHDADTSVENAATTPIARPVSLPFLDEPVPIVSDPVEEKVEEKEEEKKPAGPVSDPPLSSITGDPNGPEPRLILDQFCMYETKMRFYVVASNQSDSRHRILKIDRTAAAHEPLNITEDPATYSKEELKELLRMIEEGNSSTGGLSTSCPNFYGIVGFIRFTGGWYVVLIKRRVAVALIGGHYIYHCEETLILPITRSEKTAEEARLLAAFQQVDLSKNFYFSYTYDLTNTLQVNLTGTRLATARDKQTRTGPPTAWGYNDKFVWNHYLLNSAFSGLDDSSNWVLPLIYGFVEQAKIDIFGRNIYITLIARRSRHFAGARFHRRGVNDLGFVANDVETEQIVSDATTTPLHVRIKGKCKVNPRYTSFVQVRGSIPLSWTQDTSGLAAKPPIEISTVDPYFSRAALHFDDLMCRYGTPVTILNLIKAVERGAPRETLLLPEFEQCIAYLNQSLPEPHRMVYQAYDMGTIYRKKDSDVFAPIEDITQDVIARIGFFHTGPQPLSQTNDYLKSATAPRRTVPMLQNGVCRSNCIDCLDRTNAAQFVIGKTVLGHQLYALGVVDAPHVVFETDACNILTEIYQDHGDTISMQYGGSHLVNTVESYERNPQWRSHSRDMIEAMKRYYANNFVDADKQNSIDLFLGHTEERALETVEAARRRKPRSYRQWYTPSNLEPRLDPAKVVERLDSTVARDGDYWTEFYRPRLFSDLSRHFAFKMNTAAKFAPPAKPYRDDYNRDDSPFLPRPKHSNETVLANAKRDASGVLRWMSMRSVSNRRVPTIGKRAGGASAHPPKSAKTLFDDGGADGELGDKRSLRELVNADKAGVYISSGTVIERLLARELDAAETAEYKSYTRPSQSASHNAELTVVATDRAMYEACYRIARGVELPDIRVDSANHATYKQAVKLAYGDSYTALPTDGDWIASW